MSGVEEESCGMMDGGEERVILIGRGVEVGEEEAKTNERRMNSASYAPGGAEYESYTP